MTANTDVVNEVTGNFGKWQLRAILIIFLCKIPSVWFLAVIIFTAPAPNLGEYWCKPPANITNHTEWVLQSHPIRKYDTDKEFEIDFCRVYEDAYDDHIRLFELLKNDSFSVQENRKIVPCENFHFNSEFHSLIKEFNLVCSRRLLVTLSQCFHVIGLLIGGIVAHFLLKRFSPKTVLLFGMLAQIVSGILCGQTRFYELHVLFRCIAAAACCVMCVSGQMIIVDITGGRAKTLSVILFELFWSLGLIVLPGLSIFFNNWSHLYIVISLPTLVMVFLHRFIPDSPRWMLLHGRLKKSKEILLKSAEINKREVPEDIESLLSIASSACIAQSKKEASWYALWSHRTSLVLAVYYAWAIFILVFNTMILNVNMFGQKFIHFNTTMMGFSELIGMMLGLYLVLYTRRKWIWVGAVNSFIGALTFTIWFIPSTMKDTHQVGLAMIACVALKISVSSAMSVLTACTAELFAPEMRKIMMLSAGIWGRSWIIWAPFVFVLRPYGSIVPVSVMALLAVIGGVLCIVVGRSQTKNLKNQQKNENVRLIVSKENHILLETKA